MGLVWEGVEGMTGLIVIGTVRDKGFGGRGGGVRGDVMQGMGIEDCGLSLHLVSSVVQLRMEPTSSTPTCHLCCASLALQTHSVGAVASNDLATSANVQLKCARQLQCVIIRLPRALSLTRPVC